LSRGLGRRARTRRNRGRDDLADADGEVLLLEVPAHHLPHVLVAEDATELSLGPDGDVELGGDAPGRAVVTQTAGSRIGGGVADVQRSCFAEGLEIVGELGREEFRAVLELARAGDEARIAGELRPRVVEAPEAHTLGLEHLGVELTHLLDPRAPLRTRAARQLEQQWRRPESHLIARAQRILAIARRLLGIEGHRATARSTGEMRASAVGQPRDPLLNRLRWVIMDRWRHRRSDRRATA
jgi:hypothetical protein